jgi:hypothetical protein
VENVDVDAYIINIYRDLDKLEHTELMGKWLNWIGSYESREVKRISRPHKRQEALQSAE